MPDRDTEASCKRKYLFIAFSIILLYMSAATVLTFSRHTIGNYGGETDFFWEYVPFARSLLAGDVGFSQFLLTRSCVYSGFLASLHWISGADWFLLGRLASISAITVAFMFLFLLLRNVCESLTAVLVLMALVSTEIIQRQTYEVGNDSLNLAFLSIALYFLLDERSSLTGLITGAVFAGLAFFTRANMVIFLPYMLIVRLWHYRRLTERRWRAFLPLMIFLVFFGSWVTNNVMTGGTIANQSSMRSLVYFYFQDNPELARKAENLGVDEQNSLTSLIALDPIYFVQRTTAVFARYIRLDLTRVLNPWFIVLIVGGLILIPPWRWRTGKRNLLLLFGMMNILILSLAEHFERFSLPHVVFWYILAIYPLISRSQTWRRSSRIASVVPIIVIIGVSFISASNRSWTKMAEGPTEILPVVAYLQTHQDVQGWRIASRKPQIGYYADLPWTALTDNSNPQALAQWAVKQNVRLLLWSGIEEALLPNLRFLGAPQNHGPWKLMLQTPEAFLYKLDLLSSDDL